MPGVDDCADFDVLLEAMRLFMPESDIRHIIRLLTAIIQIGNIKILGALFLSHLILYVPPSLAS